MPVYRMIPLYQLSLCWLPFCRMSRRRENVTADLPRFPRNSFTGFLNPFQSRSSSFSLSDFFPPRRYSPFPGLDALQTRIFGRGESVIRQPPTKPVDENRFSTQKSEFFLKSFISRNRVERRREK
jgi:hypothetical protein